MVQENENIINWQKSLEEDPLYSRINELNDLDGVKVHLKHWLKIVTSIALLFSIVYLFIHAEYRGVTHKEHRFVTLMTLDCKMIYRGSSICTAKVKSDDGFVFEGLSDCDASNVGKRVNLNISLGLFSRKERNYIFCE